MKKTSKIYGQVLLFVNGPYQLMVGVACIRRHIQNIDLIEAISYDMKWQKELEKVVYSFAKVLKISVRNLPIEVKKSTIANNRTFLLRSILNHVAFYLYCKKFRGMNIFIPKVYGSPERAIILASRKKNIFIYDDGYGQYIDPRVNQGKIDSLLYKFIENDKQHHRSNIIIAPRQPQLITYDSYQNTSISKQDYSKELKEVIKDIAMSQDLLQMTGNYRKSENLFVLISLPRLAMSSILGLGIDLDLLVNKVSNEFPTLVFLLKPHPRDVVLDFQELSRNIGKPKNWELLPRSLWCYPVEVLSQAINPRIILTGNSTIGINSDLLPKTKVMVFDFLSFNMPYYNDHATRLMKSAGNYRGKTVEEAINLLIYYFKNENR